MSTTDDYAGAEGPGKFEGNAYPRAAAQVYDWSLEGCCDAEVGSVQEMGWYGLVHNFDAEDVARLRALGYDDDSDPVAAIIHEDSQGFVDVTFYASEPEQEWKAIEEAYDKFYDDEEGDDDD